MRESDRNLHARAWRWGVCGACVLAIAAGGASGVTVSSALPDCNPVLAYADDSASGAEAEGDRFTAGGISYLVTQAAQDGVPGTVQVSNVPIATQGALTIPSQVTSDASGLSYQVTSVYFGAFLNRSGITSVSFPASISSFSFDSVGACLRGCTALETVTVEGGSSALISEDGVLYAAAEGQPVTLLAYPQAKASESFTVPASVQTVSPYAFAGNTSLKSVSFSAGLNGDAALYAVRSPMQRAYEGGLGASAFEGCTALESVTFPEGATLATCSSNDKAAVGQGAFKDCTALKSITVPAILTADMKSNAYSSFAELNPESNLTGSTTENPFVSGYQQYWHDARGPIARMGIDSEAFSGCTALESITFAAGNRNGAFAYWWGLKTLFTGCANLTSVVFEGAQAYWGNPNASMSNAAYTDIWTDSDGNTIASPTYYYAVDYYATEADAEAADSTGSTRLARMEFARGTSTADIATSAQSLDGQTADRALYAQTDTDGNVPDPNEAAAAAGLGEGDWAWKLTGTQSKREGLTESCKAYLVNRNDLSAGRLEASQVTALYRQADRNLSQGSVPGTAFDPYRYAHESTYVVEPNADEDTAWFTYNSQTESLDQGFSVRSADGTALPESSYALSYEWYSPETDKLSPTALGAQTGAYLVTVTAREGSGFTGSFQEWILVQGHTGTLTEGYGEGPADTASKARRPYPDQPNTSVDFSSAAYAVSIGTNDAIGALVGASYAGMVQGAVNASTTEDAASATYGFYLYTQTYSDGYPRSGSPGIACTRDDGEGNVLSASDYAAQFYQAFKANPAYLGLRSCTWGSTAVVVPVGSASDLTATTAYAYAHQAPIFFTEEDGTVSEATRACLADFPQVVVMGNRNQIAETSVDALRAQLGTGHTVSRIGDATSGAGAFSIAVAEALVSEGKASWSNVTVSDGQGPADAAAALNYTGHEGGITLVVKSTAEAKTTAQLLHEHAFDIDNLVLYGLAQGTNATALASSSWDGNAFGAIWSDDATFQSAMDAVTSSVDEYSGNSNNGNGNEANGQNGQANDNGSSDSGTSSNDAGSVAASGHGSGASSASGRPSASASAGASTSSAASPANASASSGATASPAVDLASRATTYDGPAESTGSESPANEAGAEDGADQTGPVNSTPLSQKIPFLAGLAALCSASIPTLKRIR